jgi:tRNA pseudouridine55 synthase
MLGATTPSFDAETPIDQKYDISHITREMILDTVRAFKGKIKQTPPIFSAVKVEGKPAYLYARKDKEVILKQRDITITEFDILRIELPEVDFRISCSKGTYIRSIARDFGIALNIGAYLTSLCRTRIGEFLLEDAITPEEFRNTVPA